VILGLKTNHLATLGGIDFQRINRLIRRRCEQTKKKSMEKDGHTQGCQMLCIFSDQKSRFGYILQGLGMENVFSVRFQYLKVVWKILRPFGIPPPRTGKL
jgi:hypothetical protein